MQGVGLINDYIITPDASEDFEGLTTNISPLGYSSSTAAVQVGGKGVGGDGGHRSGKGSVGKSAGGKGSVGKGARGKGARGKGAGGRGFSGAPGGRGTLARGRTGHPSQQPAPSAEELVRRLKSSRSRHERQRALSELAVSPHRGQLTAHAYTVVIATAGRDNGWRDALRWLDLMRREGRVLDVFHYSAAINACAKGRQWEQAMLLLDAMSKNGVPPDCVCFNGAISACARGGRWERALGLLDEMQLKGHQPNLISYSSAISACSKGGCWERALQLLHEMRQAGHWPNVITLSAAISACDKGGQWERALALLQEMIHLGLEADVVSYNAAISACAKGKQWAAALSLLQQMRQDSITPNVITYNAAIAACEKGDQWMRALMLLDEMRQTGNRPDVISYNASIGACDRGAQGKRAVALLQEMRRSGITLEAVSYSGAISACAKEGGGLPTAMKLWREMLQSRLEPTEACCMSIFEACKKLQMWHPAVAVLHQLEQMGKTPSAEMYSAGADACEAAGQVSQANAIRGKVAAVAAAGVMDPSATSDTSGSAPGGALEADSIPEGSSIGNVKPKAVSGTKFSFAAVAATLPQAPASAAAAAWTSSSPPAMLSSTVGSNAMTPVAWSTAATPAPGRPPANYASISPASPNPDGISTAGDVLGGPSEWRLTTDERDRAVAVAPVGDWQAAVREASWKQAAANRASAGIALAAAPPSSGGPLSDAMAPINNSIPTSASPNISLQPTLGAVQAENIGDTLPSPGAFTGQLQPTYMPFVSQAGNLGLSPATPTIPGSMERGLIPDSRYMANEGLVGCRFDTMDGVTSTSELNVDAQPFSWNPEIGLHGTHGSNKGNDHATAGLDEYLANLVLDEAPSIGS